MGVPDPVFISVHGNAAVPQGGSIVPTVGGPGRGNFGWGSQFDLGTSLSWSTPQEILDRAFIFHFPFCAPTAIPDPGRKGHFFRASVMSVGVQGNFHNCELRWIDLWDRDRRFYTTTPENPGSSQREIGAALNLSGDFTQTWNVGDPGRGLDLYRDNVIQFEEALRTNHVVFGGIGVSVALSPLGAANTGGQNFGGSGVVTFTQVGTYLEYVAE
jgi:hypothetical protein